MVRLLARVMGTGIEITDMLVQEVLVAKPQRSTRRRALCGNSHLARPTRAGRGAARKGWR